VGVDLEGFANQEDRSDLVANRLPNSALKSLTLLVNVLLHFERCPQSCPLIRDFLLLPLARICHAVVTSQAAESFTEMSTVLRICLKTTHNVAATDEQKQSAP
jgi:hypothetical protein